MDNCSTCRFASMEIREHNSEGEKEPTPYQICRRYPPVLLSYVDIDDTIIGGKRSYFGQSYPTVDDGDWCGEHQPIERPA